MMKAMMFGGAAAIMGGGMYAAGAFEGGEVYNQPVAQVYSTLAYMPMPEEMKDIYNAMPGSDLRVARVPNESVTWRFTQEGHEMGVFRATLTPEGESSTRVKVEFEAGDDIPEGEVKEMVSLPLVRSMASIAMAEQVDSTLEKREFDKNKMTLALAAYVATHQAEVAQYGLAMQSAMREIENVEPKPRNGVEQARIGGAAPMTSAKPMVDVSKYNESR